MIQREENARQDLRSDRESVCESGVDADRVPKHVAIIMDGNRRYGKQVYGNATSGHWDGSRKVLQVAKWCIAENVRVLTVFAFSTENWRREPTEVASLMALFVKYCEELRVEAIRRNIRVRILSTDASKVPAHVKAGFDKLQSDTEHCEGGLDMNICLSYGSRGELVSACRELAKECVAGNRDADSISEEDVQGALLTRHTCDPDVLIRTSGEERISNFLLWQLAYTELFFLDKHWPEFEKDDLLKVIRTFASGRERRYGA
jgi:undecaprenyl diphosphate synthase